MNSLQTPHTLRPARFRNETSLHAGEHEDARDCGCHSSMLARGPERERGQGMESAGLAVYRLWGRKRNVWLGIV